MALTKFVKSNLNIENLNLNSLNENELEKIKNEIKDILSVHRQAQKINSLSSVLAETKSTIFDFKYKKSYVALASVFTDWKDSPEQLSNLALFYLTNLTSTQINIISKIDIPLIKEMSILANDIKNDFNINVPINKGKIPKVIMMVYSMITVLYKNNITLVSDLSYILNLIFYRALCKEYCEARETSTNLTILKKIALQYFGLSHQNFVNKTIEFNSSIHIQTPKSVGMSKRLFNQTEYTLNMIRHITELRTIQELDDCVLETFTELKNEYQNFIDACKIMALQIKIKNIT